MKSPFEWKFSTANADGWVTSASSRTLPAVWTTWPSWMSLTSKNQRARTEQLHV